MKRMLFKQISQLSMFTVLFMQYQLVSKVHELHFFWLKLQLMDKRHDLGHNQCAADANRHQETTGELL